LHHLEIKNLCSAYGKTEVLKDVSLSVDKGEVVSLIGPSGSGKSTLLRVLIGLTPPTGGDVFVAGDKIDYRQRKHLKALRDKMSIVFQQYNLFQHQAATRLLDKVGMSDKHDAYPDELSGGQQQRVAIARALATEPEILLLDEVTSALDPERVKEVLDTIRSLTDEGITLMIVSHEMAFVREVSTRVAMMDDGRIIEYGTPEAILDTPQETRTREFVSKILKH
jgi:polar amino acid transport system ATP-binding protein